MGEAYRSYPARKLFVPYCTTSEKMGGITSANVLPTIYFGNNTVGRVLRPVGAGHPPTEPLG